MNQIILYGCWGFIFWVLRTDAAWRRAGSASVWICATWLAIQGSRPLSYWISGGSGESHPINTVSFAVFLFLSIVVLTRKRVQWGAFVGKNTALCLIYGYLLLSALWSDIAFDALKRLVKDFESVLVAAIFLAEINPVQAIRAIYFRVAAVLFPLSVVFIKYFPEIGRNSSRAGDTMFTGVTTQKNSLGETVFVLSLVILWDLCEVLREKHRQGRNIQLSLRLGLLLMGGWLLVTCDSKTSIFCLLLGSALFYLIARLKRRANGKKILIAALVSVGCVVALDQSLGISEWVSQALGRDATLTGRTEIWRLVLAQQQEPLIGYGYFSFWDSKRGAAVVDAFMKINTAHNGFLEMYLDGGIIGCTLLVLFLFFTGVRLINRAFAGHPLGEIGLIFWLLCILYNFSESSFFRMDVLWFSLLLFVVELKTRLPGTAHGVVPY